VNDLGHVTRAEWQRVSLFVLAVMLMTTLPYGIGWLSAGDQWAFGGSLFGAEDSYSYLAKMRLGARGDWLFTMRYTSESHQGALLFLPYIALGHLVAVFVDADDPALVDALMIAFHVARVILGAALLLISYRFVAVFMRGPGTRFLALVMITLGGGFGWLLTLVGLGHWLGSLPVDFFVPEGYSFLILFGLPHLALARSLLLLGFLLFFRALLMPDEARRWLIWALLAGGSWAAVGIVVPFYVPLVYLLLGGWGLAAWVRERRFPWRLFWRAVGAVAVTLPYLAYTAAVFLTNEVLGKWSSQNQLPSPHPVHYLLGYGVMAVPAVVGARWMWRRAAAWHGALGLLLIAWIVAVPVAVYLPINVQRRLAEGVIVPLGILAAAGLRLAFPDRRRWRRARAIVLTLVLPTALLLWLGGLVAALTPDRPLFFPQAEIAALRCLDGIAGRDAVVLSTKETGAILPVYADVRAYIGHGPETIDSDAKGEMVRQFLAGELTPEARRTLLDQVDYVLVGASERAEAVGTSWQDGLRVVPGCAQGDEVAVYEVIDEVPRD